jgi:hypothetical protein
MEKSDELEIYKKQILAWEKDAREVKPGSSAAGAASKLLAEIERTRPAMEAAERKGDSAEAIAALHPLVPLSKDFYAAQVAGGGQK